MERPGDEVTGSQTTPRPWHADSQARLFLVSSGSQHTAHRQWFILYFNLPWCQSVCALQSPLVIPSRRGTCCIVHSCPLLADARTDAEAPLSKSTKKASQTPHSFCLRWTGNPWVPWGCVCRVVPGNPEGKDTALIKGAVAEQGEY